MKQWKRIRRNNDGSYTAISVSGFSVTGTLGELLKNEIISAKEIDEFFQKLLSRNRIKEKQCLDVIQELVIESL